MLRKEAHSSSPDASIVDDEDNQQDAKTGKEEACVRQLIAPPAKLEQPIAQIGASCMTWQDLQSDAVHARATIELHSVLRQYLPI